jgi:hypothetical protein
VNCRPGHIQCNYSTSYSGFNIRLNVSVLLSEIIGHVEERCTATLVPNIPRILWFTLCELWSRDIQCNYRSAYTGFNIQLNVTALLLEISRQFSERYTANLVANTAHNHQFAQCEQWSRTYKMYLLLRIFRLQYSTERICAATRDMSTIQCELYCKHGAKYSAHPAVYVI